MSGVNQLPERRCRTCRFFERGFYDGSEPVCCRNPPIADDDFVYGRWPTPHPDHWCGEWKEAWESPAHTRPVPPPPPPPQNVTTTKGLRPPTEGEIAEANELPDSTKESNG